MNYYKNNIVNVKGDTFSCALKISGLDQDLDAVEFTCRDGLNDDSNVLFTCSLGDGISLVETLEDGTRNYAIRVSPEKTENLQAGTYYYDEKVQINSDVFTIMKGRFVLEQDCSREI